MKYGTITQTNKKGQVVIPKKIRDSLNIDEDTSLNIVQRGNSIYIQPIKDVVVLSESESSYEKVLEKTRGTWKADKWERQRKARKDTELKSSKIRKKQW